MQDNSYSYDIADFSSFVGILEKVLDDVIRHLQQEDQLPDCSTLDWHNLKSELLLQQSEPEQKKLQAAQTSTLIPPSQSPAAVRVQGSLKNQLPNYSSLEWHKRKAELPLQEDELESFQTAQTSTLIPPSQSPAAVRVQGSLQNQLPTYSSLEWQKRKAELPLQENELESFQAAQTSTLIPPSQSPAAVQGQGSLQNQLPNYSSLEWHKLKTELPLQESERESFQGAQTSTLISPKQSPAAVQGQTSLHSQKTIFQPPKPNPERMKEKEEIHELPQIFKNRRRELISDFIMDRSRSNDKQDSSSGCGTPDLQSNDVIPSSDQILDATMRHPPQEYQNMQSKQTGAFLEHNPMSSTTQVQDSSPNQVSPQHIQEQNMQSPQFCGVLQQNTMLSTIPVQDSSQNQLEPQKLQHQNMQSTQHYELCPPGQLHPTEYEVYFENQLSPHCLQHQNLQSMQPCELGLPIQMPPTEVHISSQNQVQVSSFNQVPVSIVAEELQLNDQDMQQQFQHYHLQSTQYFAILPPCQSPTPMQDMIAFQNQNENDHVTISATLSHVLLHTQPSPDHERGTMTEEELHKLVKTFKIRRKQLWYSQESVRKELNKLSQKYNMQLVLSKNIIYKLENQMCSIRKMLHLKPLLELWLECKRNATPLSPMRSDEPNPSMNNPESTLCRYSTDQSWTCLGSGYQQSSQNSQYEQKVCYLLVPQAHLHE